MVHIAFIDTIMLYGNVAITCWIAQKKLMEKKREEVIIKLQGLLKGWLVRRSHQRQKAAIIRFQAGNIILSAYARLYHLLKLCEQQLVVSLLGASLQQENKPKKRNYFR